MGFTINCPQCGHGQQVEDSAIGRQNPCAGCGHVFRMEYPYAPPQSLSQRAPAGGGELSIASIDLGAAFNDGFDVYKRFFGPLAVVSLVYCSIQLGIGMLQQIPLLGIIVALAVPFTIQPVLTSGFYVVCLKLVDGEIGKVDDLFGQFEALGQLALMVLVQMAFWAVGMIPTLGIAAIGFVPTFIALDENPNFEPEVWQIAAMAGGGLLVFAAMIILSLAFMWCYLAFVDRKAGFWDAITTSWQITKNNPWPTLGVALLGGIIIAAGILVCLVGVVFTLPAAFCIFAAAYRQAMPRTAGAPVATIVTNEAVV